MRFWKFVLSKIEGRKPTVNQLDHETIAKNIRSGALYVLRESAAGVKEVIEVAGGPPGTGESHLRAHQIDSADDHPAVPAEKRNRWVHTNAETGEIELIEQGPQGDPGLTPFIGENGNWWIGEDDTGVQAEGEDGAPGADGEDGASAFLYIAYASDDSGTGFSLSPGTTLTHIAALTTSVYIVTPQASDFVGLWRKYVGEDGTANFTHYCYIAWRDAPGDGFTLTPNLSAAYEAILITHTELTAPVEADFDGYWRERLTIRVIHEVPAGGTTGQVIKKQSNDDFDIDWEDDNGGGSGGSTELVAIPPIDQTASGITTNFTANEAQAFGDVVRLNSAGKAQIAKADVIANATALAMCISATVEAEATGEYLLLGFVRNDAWDWTVGGDIYLTITGTSGNTLSQTSPFAADPIVEDTVVQLLGVANSADSFYFNPQLVQVELKP